MYKIAYKEKLNDSVTLMKIVAPDVASKAKAGQFIILRADEEGERIPLTVADTDEKEGTVTIIFQIVGATTMALNDKNEGEYIPTFAGPSGKATELDCLKKVAVIGGGVGSAIAYPIAKALKKKGAVVHSVVGFRNKDIIILEKEFEKVSDKLVVCTDDGSYGRKGLVTDALKELIDGGERYDEVITIGPLMMMKFVAKLTKEYGIKTVASMNPVMVDGTGMCGGCRLTVGGKMKFACVDGPDFDAHEVDFDEVIKRNGVYKEFEKKKREEYCNLYKGVK